MGIFGPHELGYPEELDYTVAGMVYLDPYFETDEYPPPADHLFLPVDWRGLSPGTDGWEGASCRFMEDGGYIISLYERCNDPEADDNVHSKYCICTGCVPLAHGPGCKCFQCLPPQPTPRTVLEGMILKSVGQ